MTDKEIAKRLREIAKTLNPTIRIESLADELDPPRPEPGTVVWWRDAEGLGEWSLGQINNNRKVEFFGAWKELDLEAVQIKPARIAKPMQEIADIPAVSEWPDDVGSITQRMIPHRSRTSHTIITREEAARREVEG